MLAVRPDSVGADARRTMSGPACVWSARDLEERKPSGGRLIDLYEGPDAARFGCNSSVAEERYKWLFLAARSVQRPVTPGSLYVGSCEEAVQWAGQHCDYVINAANKGYYAWHEYCVRFWMNISYKECMDGLTWHDRLCTVVWIVLTALLLGANVLIHCRQGKHRSGVLAMLIMAILAPDGKEHYDDVEDKYLNRNPRVQSGQRLTSDRWRLWNLWQQHEFKELTKHFRKQWWVEAIVQRIVGAPPPQPAAFSLLPPVPGRRPPLRVRSRSPIHKALPGRRPPPCARSRSPIRKARPCKSSATKSLANDNVLFPVPSRRPPRARSGSPIHSAATAKALAKPSAKVQPILLPTAKLRTPPPRRHRPPPPSRPVIPQVLIDARRSACDIPWPCAKCSLMPWRCRCRSLVSSVQSESDSDAEFERTSKRAGVWATASEQQREASARAAREQSPEPDREAAMWACPACHSMNTVHNLTCSVASCGSRRPLLQKFCSDRGDWICLECNNHNKGNRRWCNWTACHTNDWMCECGNVNRSNRKFCMRRVCGRPRPWSFD